MNITKKEFEKSKNNFNKYRRLMEKNQEIMMTYITGSSELPEEYNTPIQYLGFGVRLMNILRSGRIETLGDLCKSTPTDLFKLRGFGKKNLRVMKEFLDSKGIKWGEIGVINGYIQ